MNATTMQTFSGRMIDLRQFAASDVSIDDIAHSLSIVNRFTGHSKVPYSVAQHSVMVSRLVRPEHAMWGLLHDASEAYLGDVARPLKAMLPEYKELEQHVQQEIAKAFYLCWPIPDEVKLADNRALMAEKRDLIPCDHDWGIDVQPMSGPVSALRWHQAKMLFLNRYKELE
jgi:5'-deoxynucleotidase YfbR-like HD superfamily hydrolase